MTFICGDQPSNDSFADDVHSVANRDALAAGEAAGFPVVGDPDGVGEFGAVLDQCEGLGFAEVLEGPSRVTGEDQPAQAVDEFGLARVVDFDRFAEPSFRGNGAQAR